MLYTNFFILLIFYTKFSVAYIYPILCRSCGYKIDAVASKLELEDESQSGMDIIRSIIVPISNGVCNIWINFLEVYHCVYSKYFLKEEERPIPKPKSFIDELTYWIGFAKEEEPPIKCSYYAFTIVSVSILFLMCLLYSIKKMMDYFREDEYPFEVGFNKRFNMCSCKLNDFIYDD